ncbi:c-type cytochrome [Enterovirga rhinocerotis]|uniref:Cytochrome c n=1 Tax=Enterovirga rhinocerotis TaxID=1339210 RepID=A0A4R7C034_9HYPH|nr:cytochrome c family protein [Enterovirga rhinocerotis]TDR89827.1 cytochrome c [Enterovirga rhinocerotis]
MASGDANGKSLLDKLTGGDPLFWNKVSGGILAAATLAVGLQVFSTELFTPKKPAIPGYDLPAPEAGAPAAAAAPTEPLPVRLAAADPAKGQASAKKCIACHVFEKGGPNKIGPGLYGVVEHDKATHAGFNYSSGLKAKGGKWTYEDLDHFLENPRGFAPGTIMAFAGIPNAQERANILAYLKTLSDSPVEFPKPE